MREKFKKGEIVSATRTFNGEIITGEFLGYRLFNDENPDTVVGIVDVPGDGVYDVDVTSLKHYVKSTRYSDDEKIRNEIIDFFRSAANGQTKVISGANSLMWADWLEKQKEQKPSIFPPGLGEVRWNPISPSSVKQKPAEWSEEDKRKIYSIIKIICTERECSRIANIGESKKDNSDFYNELVLFIKSLRPQPKQEWSDEDEKHINSIFNDFKQNVIPDEEDQEWLKNRFETLSPQPKQEWSEEDEKMLQRLLDCLRNGWTKLPTDILMYESWLKSLRPQPKQEWSEEDEKTLNAIISVLREIKSQPLKRLEDWDGYIHFLKSLRPHWKPSKEQMAALKESSASWMNEMMGNEELLKSLYEQLKAL